MSPTSTEERKPGVKGRRVPGRPGRFDPSMPLHMTTRTRAKKGTTNGTPSINGSMDDDESLRSSIDDARPMTAHSQISQTSANETQVPDIAETAATPDLSFNDAQIIADSDMVGSEAKPLSPVQRTLSPSRKRKRESPTPPASPDGLFVTATPTQQLQALASDEEDVVELVDPALLSDRQASNTSSESGEQPDEDIAVTAPSLADTPAASAQVSPASSVSGSKDLGQLKDGNDIADVVMQMDGPEVADDADEVDEVDDADDQARSPGGRHIIRKFGGKRRRAAHPNIMIESGMRRHLELRKAFRAIAREQKAVLAEIARRTIDDLTANPASCEEATEYHAVKSGLDAALEKRRTVIQVQQNLDRALLDQRLHDEMHVAKSTYSLQVSDAQDAYLDRMEHQILGIARAAQLHATAENADTDHEDDDVVPRPKRTAYRFKRGDALDPKYDSRSRLALETERALHDMSKRAIMRKMLQELDEDERPTAPQAFTVMDRVTRDATQARTQEVTNFDILARAASEVERIAIEDERIANIPHVRNEDAQGLQLLGDLATRPSITLAAQEAVRAKLSRDTIVNPTPPRPALSPREPPADSQPIHFSMSPRAEQIMHEHYAASMPPPAHTPGQSHSSLAISPDFRRQERPLASPTSRGERINGLPPIAAKPSDHEHQSRYDQAPFRHLERRVEAERRLDSGVNHREEIHSHQPSRPSPWRDHVEALTGVPDRRARSAEDRPPFNFLRETHHVADERRGTTQAGTESRLGRPIYLKDETPVHNSPLHGRPWDRASNPGNIEHRTHRTETATAIRPRLTLETLESPRSRRSSVSLKQEILSDGSPAGDHPRQSTPARSQGQQHSKFQKTNLEQRGGKPRRWNKNKNKKQRQHSLGTPGFSGPSQGGATPVTYSPAERTPHPYEWQPPSAQHTNLPPPPPQPNMPPPPFAPQYRGQPPSPFPFGQLPPEYDHGQHQHHQHRNSFPPPQHSPPGWSQPPPQSPLYAVPPGQRPPPPPPGVPPDQYQGHHAFVPPPPPQYQAHPPMPPHSQPPPGSYGGHQYGGPAIAPAGPDPRFHAPGFGPGPNHLPVFAQQQRHNEGHRRRTQSDTHRDRGWTSYNGPPSRR